MKKRLFTLALALILCLGLFPLTAFAGEPTWTGGNDPNCKHRNATGACERLDDQYHQYRFTCPDCGAKGTLPGDAPSLHNWGTYPISPGNPDGTYPYGGDLEICNDCGAQVSFAYGPDGHTYCQHPNKTQISTIEPGSTGFPNGGKILQCDVCKMTFEVPNEASCTHSSTTKKYDASKHWDECNSCHAHLNEAAHSAQYWKYNDSSHWHECSCGYNMGDTAAHTLVDQTPVNGKIVSKCTCGYSATRPVPDLSQVETTGDPNQSYTQQGIAAVGLKGLQEGRDYTSQTVASQDEDGNDIWIKTFKPIEGRSVGEKVFKGKRGEEIHTVPTFKLTVHYVAENADDQKRMPQDVNAKVYQNDYYRYQSPSVHGLYPDVRVVEGKMPNSDLTITVTYSNTQVTVPKDAFTLTIHYVAADPKFQSKMPATYTEVVREGKKYSRFSPYMPGFRYDIEEVAGDMPAHDLEVTVTYTKTYTLTIVMYYASGNLFNSRQEDDEENKTFREFYRLDDGASYHYTIEDLLDPDTIGNNIEKGDGGLYDDIARGAMILSVHDTLGSSAVATSRNEITGKIKGADKVETVLFACTHPDGSYEYSSNEDGSHDISCGVCGSVIAENMACEYDYHEYVVGELSKDMQAKYPNGAAYYQCPKCEHEYWVNPDEEPCPESPEGLLHIWTLWYPADEGHCHRTCARCGLDVTEPHAWSEWTSLGGINHYRKCQHCKESQTENHGNWTNITVTSPATCTENAKVSATCGICGARVENITVSILPEEYKATGHDFENGPWHISGSATVSSPSAGGHYKSCAVCGVTDSENTQPHTWGAKTVVNPGKCEDPNNKRVEEATCTVCGAHLREETELHHNQVRYPEGDIAATCEEFGKEAYKCTICGEIFGDAIPPLGHDMQEVERKDATCEAEGYIKRKCSRCDKEETEVLEKKSTTGQHTWVPDIGQQPTCETDGTVNGEVCSVCGAHRTDGKYGVGIMPALGHQVKKETHAIGRTKDVVTDDGVIEVTCYETIFYCGRCYAGLGAEYYTVGTNNKVSKYVIEPGKNVQITSVGNGVHIDGNMADDGGCYFNGEAQKALGEVVDQAGEKYTYKKTKANSFIIEFTDEFMEEQADGEYELIVINGQEYWPMIVVVKDHKFVEIKNLPDEGADAPEWTLEQLEAWKADLIAQGNEVKELYQGCSEGRDN